MIRYLYWLMSTGFRRARGDGESTGPRVFEGQVNKLFSVFLAFTIVMSIASLWYHMVRFSEGLMVGLSLLGSELALCTHALAIVSAVHGISRDRAASEISLRPMPEGGIAPSAQPSEPDHIADGSLPSSPRAESVASSQQSGRDHSPASLLQEHSQNNCSGIHKVSIAIALCLGLDVVCSAVSVGQIGKCYPKMKWFIACAADDWNDLPGVREAYTDLGVKIFLVAFLTSLPFFGIDQEMQRTNQRVPFLWKIWAVEVGDLITLLYGGLDYAQKQNTFRGDDYILLTYIICFTANILGICALTGWLIGNQLRDEGTAGTSDLVMIYRRIIKIVAFLDCVTDIPVMVFTAHAGAYQGNPALALNFIVNFIAVLRCVFMYTFTDAQRRLRESW